MCWFFIGNWDKSAYGQELKRKYSGVGNIQLIDPVYDLDVLYVLRNNCCFYIHGHSAGGTNPSLVEAMFLIVRFWPMMSYIIEKLPKIKLFILGCRATDCSFKKRQCFIVGEVCKDMSEIANRRYLWEGDQRQYLEQFDLVSV